MDNNNHTGSVSSNVNNNANSAEFVDRFTSMNIQEFPPTNLNNNSRSLPNYMDISLLHSSQSTSSNSVSNISNMMPSKLNPRAQEFVPRSALATSIMPPMMLSQYYRVPAAPVAPMALAPPPVPNNYHRYFNGAKIFSDGDSYIEDYMSLSFMKDFINQISNQPSLYDKGIKDLTLVINSYLDEDDCVLELIVNQIVDQSIIDGNFRHNGVRLCVHFMNELRESASGQTFKQLLFKRNRRECSRKLTDKSSVKTFEHLRGLALFTADLYSRCQEEDLVSHLPSLLLNILSFEIQRDANVKCVWQVMKLCGQQMYQYFACQMKPDFDELVEKIRKTLDWNISAHNKNMVNKILTLIENKWIEPTASIPFNMVNPYYNMENVAMAPEGSNYEPTPTIPSPYYMGYPDVYDFGSCGDESNAEVCKDFEDFLKSTQQS